MDLEIVEMLPGVRVPVELVPVLVPHEVAGATKFQGALFYRNLEQLAEQFELGLRDKGPLEHVLRRAWSVFGAYAVAHAWIRHPSGALGGAVPSALVKTDAGFSRVEQVLDRIEQTIGAMNSARSAPYPVAGE